MQKRRVPIIAYNFVKDIRYDFISQREAEQVLGISQGEISDVLNGRRRHVNGWLFVRQGENIPEFSDIDIHHHAKKPLIKAINLNTGEIRVFEGLTAAAKDLGVHISAISTILHGKARRAKSWCFEYVDSEGYNE